MISFDQGDRDVPRVVISGIGLVSPLGFDRETTWSNLLASKLAIRQLGSGEVDHFSELQQIAQLRLFGAPVDHSEVLTRLERLSDLRPSAPCTVSGKLLDPVVAMSLLACHEALQQAGLPLNVGEHYRTGCTYGASKGGLRSIERLLTPSEDGVSMDESQERQLGDMWWYSAQTDSATRAMAAMTKVKAFMACPVAACATGLISILQAALAIRSGQCDVCIAGSSDAAIRASVLSSFHRLRVTSRHPVAASACRPFDRDRDGFAIGEGAGVLILESESSASRRGVRPLARLSAGGWLSDSTGMTQIDTSGSVVAELLSRTLQALSDKRPVDYVNLHGTGTESNDLAEGLGMKHCFQNAIPPCSGFKGQIGHLLGGASSVETGLTILAMRDQVLPASANLFAMDERLTLPLVREHQRGVSVDRVMKLSLGFGGHVACAVFDQPHDSDLPRDSSYCGSRASASSEPARNRTSLT
ncbi:MAG: beta-ketoacyl-[acyl-carrier-protein] synthase family protein [Planctomyces sp.]|nr:beta-ketoacyl-[acyl-carrier-protein] synthase family protein [Planctomyces sp.]